MKWIFSNKCEGYLRAFRIWLVVAGIDKGIDRNNSERRLMNLLRDEIRKIFEEK